MTTIFTAKQPSEEYIISFDFTPVLGTDTIASAVIVAIDETTGVDVSTTVIDVTFQSIVTPKVYTQVRAGVSGHNYILTCTIVTAGGSTFELDAILPVQDLPSDSMTNISAWLSDISERVPGASKDDIDSAVRSVIREFCTKTLLWIKQLTPISIVNGTASYTLVAPVDSAIISIERVEVNGIFVNPTSMDILDRMPTSWRVETSNQPSTFMVDAERVLRLREIPNEDVTDGLVVWVALKPTPTTNSIPDFIFDDWYESILNGSVSYLMRMPNKPWTNVQGSEYFHDFYKGYTSEAKNRKVAGKTKIAIRVQQSPFYVV